MNLGTEIEKLIIENLKKTIPASIKELNKELKQNDLIDSSTASMGFKKIKRNGVMVR